MPLLKRKRFALLPPPSYDPSKKDALDRQVWYSKITGEIFTDYFVYLQRTALYRQSIWQCESTGKSNLTYKQAMESEQAQKERVQDKMPLELQRRVLERAQFQTTRLDGVVDDVYHCFSDRFTPGEIINCLWDDGVVYNGRILQVLQDEESQQDKAEPKYKVQLIDDQLEGIDDFIKVVSKAEVKRDRLSFSKNLLKKFLRDCMTKESYIGAPWTLKPEVAERFKLNTAMPQVLRIAKEEAYAKSKKRRTAAAMDIKMNGKASTLLDARKLEASLKYPMEDLDLPMYRRDPSGNGPVLDLTPGQPNANRPPPNPLGDMPQRPAATTIHTIPSECFGSFLMIYCFLSVFARPLGLYPFSMDDFEQALRHDDPDIKPQLLIETNASLLNAVIQAHHQAKSQVAIVPASNYGYGSNMAPSRSTTPTNTTREESVQSTVEDQKPSVHETIEHLPLFERGCGSTEVNAIGQGWDSHLIPPGDDRHGWLDILIGCVNELATPEIMPDIDPILNQLVPHEDSSLEERERAYLKLQLKEKLVLMEMLVNLANECNAIKAYMEECQDQMTELRKQKIDLSRERKRILAERNELEKRDEMQNTEGNTTLDSPTIDMSDSESTESNTEQIPESRSLSRQALLKRKQIEREEREAKKLKMYHHQRQLARARLQELKARTEARKKLDEDERQLHKKEEQVEQNMRRFSTLRIKPLGRDKFFNRYFYFDNIGGANAHGSGKLFVQSPSVVDLKLIQERGDPAALDPVAPLCGRGGGKSFVCQLMKAQGMTAEAEFLEQQLEHPEEYREWWQTFEEPEELEQLLAWLKPKGIREYRLKRELEKQAHYIITGMKKRIAESNAKVEMPRRSTRNKSTATIPTGSWLAYYNKYAK